MQSDHHFQNRGVTPVTTEAVDAALRALGFATPNEFSLKTKKSLNKWAFWVYWERLLLHFDSLFEGVPVKRDRSELRRRKDILRSIFEPLGIDRHSTGAWASSDGRVPTGDRVFIAALACKVALQKVDFPEPSEARLIIACKVIRDIAYKFLRTSPHTELTPAGVRLCHSVVTSSDGIAILREIATTGCVSAEICASVQTLNASDNSAGQPLGAVFTDWLVPYLLYRRVILGSMLE